MSHRHLISTEATATVCRCGADVLDALEEGLHVRVDAHPIDRAAETAALLAGRDTYVHTLGHDLVERTPARIRADRPTGTIHVAHHCPGGHR